VIADVTAEHPCRVLNIRSRPDETASGLSAYLSAFCRPARKNQQQVCCEEIRLEASGDAARHLHTTLAALLSQDLPVFLWWRGRPPFGSHRLQQMAEMADRFIVDTAVAADPIAAVAELARWSATGNSRAATGDLAWRRLSPWREAVAALFDAADHRPLLTSIRYLELAWGAGASCPGRAQALYLAGWMAARLGWRPQAAAVEGTTGTVKLILDGPAGPISLLIRPANPGEPTLALQADDSGAGTATAQVGCGEAPQARLQRPGRPPWVRPAPALLTGTAAILSRELEFRRREPVFAEALACAGELAGLWQAAALAGGGSAW
jgi:glucose-6-phosphate dehydrogenase assembly protein OpcA